MHEDFMAEPSRSRMDKAKMMEVNVSEATFGPIAELQSASTAAASRILRLHPSGTSLGVEPRMAQALVRWRF